jgi:hypothetical protein
MFLTLKHLYFEFVSDFELLISYYSYRDTLHATRNTQHEAKTTKDYVRNYQLFLQNKPKVKSPQMNISSFITNKYVKMDTWLIQKNKPKTNPKQTQTKPNSKMPKKNVNNYPTKAYIKKTAFRRIQNKPNQTQNKPNQTQTNPMPKLLIKTRPSRPKSAKMAQRLDNPGIMTVLAESIKKPLKKPNLLKIKMLSCSHPPVPATGTTFAYLVSVR